jgi:hypothetical protein
MGLNFGVFSGLTVTVGVQALTQGGIGFGSIGGFNLDNMLSAIL